MSHLIKAQHQLLTVCDLLVNTFIIHYQLHLLHSGMNQEPLRFCIGAVLLQDFKLSDTKFIIYD